ncbi:DNA mismatch repair endonuclease MutL [Spirochaeta africana]|uniref:DNA mismatch repair protein MutL n=1 Tax=Spirochaeta africana (strain ATCC 700263 / DSM 8902 / Z-7692) TaxID=889378 RepID=H9UJ22_SPIAZ|nr:DNA mismatch repair endonuclease MutL [Spirochaeta africana]AFG37515.1 DNA mismatch repair protein MutL [Spirochaeta africana DSM 8902]
MSIRILTDAVARKIAAGEVIDRPFSVVRELIDNSIDAGADRLDLYISDGGRASIRLVDNGSGMDKQDLELCTHSHATSKISHEDDLLKVRSLGFRGEALSSIAAVSRLEIQSRSADSDNGYMLRCTLGEAPQVSARACRFGTTIEVRDLFYNLPARRHFIKSASAETRLIKQVVQDKAAAYPAIEFHMHTDQRSMLQLLPQEPLSRLQQLYSSLAPSNLWFSAAGSDSGFSVQFYGVAPDITRRDRRYVQAFVNSRRVNEFALQQAVEYAYSEYIPGGNYPIGFVFVQIDPELVDFNIHPAKKEVRFRDRNTLHHRIVEVIRSSLRSYALTARAAQSPQRISYDLDFPAQPGRSGIPGEHPGDTGDTGHPAPTRHAVHPIAGTGHHLAAPAAPRPFEAPSGVRYDLQRRFTPVTPSSLTTNPPNDQAVGESAGLSYRYLGQLFDVFLLVESGERFYIIDMHAGHERLRYDTLRHAGDAQKLVVPLSFQVEPGQTAYLQQQMSVLGELGIELEQISDTTWELTGVPQSFSGDPHRLLPFLRGESGPNSNLSMFLYATLACRSAVKEGDRLLPEQAHQIIEGVFRLEDARCPHGRPIWIEFDRQTLYTMVGRE